MQALAIRARIVSDKVATAAGLDVRLLAMLLVMAAIWLGLDALTGGNFLTPRNLFNLSLQVAVVGIMSCGMVLVIVSRHIDLSVGSQIGFIGVFGASAAELHPADRRRGDLVDRRPCDAGRRDADRARPGPAHRLRRRSLLRHHARAGCSFSATPRSTSTAASPSLRLNKTFQLLGGGLDGTIGAFWSWVVCAAADRWRSRLRLAQRAAPARCMAWPPVRRAMNILLIAIWSVCIVGFTAVMNAYQQPKIEYRDGHSDPCAHPDRRYRRDVGDRAQASFWPPCLRHGRQLRERRACRHRHAPADCRCLRADGPLVRPCLDRHHGAAQRRARASPAQ